MTDDGDGSRAEIETVLEMHPWGMPLAGRIHAHVISSGALAGNNLGDPARRPLLVYTPPGYEDEPERRYPAVYVLQGTTGFVSQWANRTAWRPPYLETADAVFSSGQAPPCVVVYVDGWTRYGGSQYVNSRGTGDYHTYLCEDVVAFVDGRYRTLPQSQHRGIQGKSSGGFGAMISPMLRPDVWGALATHAGDALFELCFLPDLGRSVRALRAYSGSVEQWWADFLSRPGLRQPSDRDLVTVLGVSSCFSPDAAGKPILPLDPATGALRPSVWDRWLAWDPVRMVPNHSAALRSLRGIWIDAGRDDDYFLDIGAAAFRGALIEAGVTDIHFELFDGTHAAIDHRYPLSLAYLAQRLAP